MVVVILCAIATGMVLYCIKDTLNNRQRQSDLEMGDRTHDNMEAADGTSNESLLGGRQNAFIVGDDSDDEADLGKMKIPSYDTVAPYDGRWVRSDLRC
jgi:hypothetical protein